MPEDPSEEAMTSEDSDRLRFYSNSVVLTYGAMDLAIDFGYQFGEQEPEDQVQIVISWEEAKVLRSFLADALEMYESAIGPVRDLNALREALAEGEEEDATDS